jgi:branched-chain amino acid transport system substrate-binding protein
MILGKRGKRFIGGCLWGSMMVAGLILPGIAMAEPVIKIGAIGPMKFEPGKNVANGVAMAAEEINAAGGISVKGMKHKIEVLVADDNCLASVPDAVSAMERLATVQKVNFIIGGYRSESVLAQQDVAADNKLIFLGPGATHPEQCTRIAKNYQRYKYFFRVSTLNSNTYALQYMATAVPVIEKIKSQLGINAPKVALLMDMAIWTNPHVDLAKKIFPQMGCEVVGVWRPAFSATDVTAELSAIKSAGAHLIYRLQAGPAGLATTKQWGAMEIPGAMVGVNASAMGSPHWEATGRVSYEASSNDGAAVEITNKTVPFFNGYIKKYKELPLYIAMSSYDGVYVLKNAVERTGTLNADAVVAAIEKTDMDVVGGRLNFYPPGHATPHDTIWGPKYVTKVGFQLINGELRVYWPDGKELPRPLIAAGAPEGWTNVKYKGTVDYQLPPWMVKYWKK